MTTEGSLRRYLQELRRYLRVLCSVAYRCGCALRDFSACARQQRAEIGFYHRLTHV